MLNSINWLLGTNFFPVVEMTTLYGDFFNAVIYVPHYQVRNIILKIMILQDLD